MKSKGQILEIVAIAAAILVLGGVVVLIALPFAYVGPGLSVPNEGTGLAMQTGNCATTDQIGSTKLPTTKGKAGIEDDPAFGGLDSDLNYNNVSQLERDWGFNMRWPIVYWQWSGRSSSSGEGITFGTGKDYAYKKMIVYNPKTGKTAVTMVVESGPAPWTGSGKSSKNPPLFWAGRALSFDPPEYRDYGGPLISMGRVAGVRIGAWKYLGAKEDDILEYGFAQDQSLKLGPITCQGTTS